MYIPSNALERTCKFYKCYKNGKSHLVQQFFDKENIQAARYEVPNHSKKLFNFDKSQQSLILINNSKISKIEIDR